ncbi:fasciclin-like arabinogalactan protein 12 [Malania oleifera]|uniref:fasciclin-like arabinogalactan protein 12 n=1 Tax=Malania oleifera TaxID=397392 RepID=UPI0025AEC663|nr:fasciclin-like arabinogalactan protein 12 [Malania oleifera]
MKSQLSLFFLLSFFFLQNPTTSAQSSPAAAPVPPGPTNITKILEKAGQFTVLIRLLRSTQMEDQINTQINNSNQGLTLLAPTDAAFSGLKAGTLNSISDEQKVQLMQFHVIPNFLSTSNFQTISNPVRTQAGNTDDGEFPLNITTSGNQVNVSSGLVDATVANTLYTDGQLAVYEVDKVLLPQNIFAPKPPAPAPSPAKSKKKKSTVAASTPEAVPADTSRAVRFAGHGGVYVGVILATVVAAFSL